MNKNAIQRYAVWARTEMIAQVSQRAYQYEITPEGYGDIDAVSISGRLLSDSERKQRQGVIRQIQAKGYTQAMEEVAYTWFNRFIALRFMEVNNYLPTHIRVFTDSSGAFKPEILTQALHLDLPNLNMDKVAHLIEENQTEDLYRYLLLTQCNALNSALPRMFESLGGYTELLLPNNILRQDGVIGRMVSDIPEEDWTDQVQIIGWLYQYYNAELKDETFALLKKNIKITKERIPSATQLFTPDWIVRYMVENSLGRLWIEGHPDSELKAGWKYYLDEPEQEPDVQEQLETIREKYRALRPQDIKVIDPCMGSGHILVYAFDVLVQIYKRSGYSERDAAQSILENNLYGLDVDDRAAQLAYFAVMMKARQYDRRILTRKVQPQVYGPGQDPEIREYGSLFLADKQTKSTCNDQISLLDESNAYKRLLAQQYNVVVTNPPYRGTTDCDKKLIDFITKNYPLSKSDLYSAFIEKCVKLSATNGFVAMITMQSWMYLSSYKQLRKSFIEKLSFDSMTVLGSNAFDSGDVGTVVQAATFVIRKCRISDYKTLFIDLNSPTTPQGKIDLFFNNPPRFITKVEDFTSTANCQFMYDVSPQMLAHFKNSPPLSQFAIAKPGMQTSDNDRFLRLWHEVSFSNIGFNLTHEQAMKSKFKWFPYNKGVGYRKWFGNNDYIVNFYNDGEELKYWLTHNPKDPTTTSWSRNLRNYPCYFQEGITFTAIGLSFSARLNGAGYLFDTKGPTMFGDYLPYLCGFVNSVVFDKYNRVLCKQMTKSSDSVNMVPVVLSRMTDVENAVNLCIDLSKSDWDSFETSWNFEFHPIVKLALHQLHLECNSSTTIEHIYNCAIQNFEERFRELKSKEEEINHIFIDIYGLQDELMPDIEDKDVTVRRAEIERDIRSLLSYAVGCMFGRYSLDSAKLIYAGGEWDSSKYTSFVPVADNIIPICDDEYFENDITNLFVKWVQIVFGDETLEENLKFIADALGGKGTPREVIRNYFLNGFYADHLKVYQKRPIYWLFDSGKKNGFKALVYIHRYRSDLLACMRTDYVHEQQERYRTQLRHIGDAIGSASGAERIRLTKQQKKLQEQSFELQKYEEKIHHLADQNIKIDLDDGVVHNYEIFSEVLAKRK